VHSSVEFSLDYMGFSTYRDFGLLSANL